MNNTAIKRKKHENKLLLHSTESSAIQVLAMSTIYFVFFAMVGVFQNRHGTENGKKLHMGSYKHSMEPLYF